MDQAQIEEQLMEMVNRLQGAQKVLIRQAADKSETERIYRINLSQEILRLRAEGHPVNLVGDIARGSVADEKFERDLSESKFRTTLEMIDMIKIQISALQSIYRRNYEI